MTPFRCTHCGSAVFFENTACGCCGARLAFDPARRSMLAYRADTDIAQPWQPWQADAPGDAQPAGDMPVPTQPCVHTGNQGRCNWMVDDAAAGWLLCRSCRLTRTIPDLTVPGHPERWARIEQAKRRLLYGLLQLGLMPQPRSAAAESADVDPETGLCFDLLADTPDTASGERVHTGHARGVITLNIAEADDAHRELVRVQLGEPQRTLLGHLRHEVAHYLQFRWIERDAQRTAQCRAVFGDERADYAQAMQRHYASGAPPGWDALFISPYASMHPWEDWAETCAHWLLIVDAVQTAAAWGLQIDGPAQASPRAPDADDLATLDAHDLVVRQWLPVAQFLNAMNRSIGLQDSYPYLIPPPVLAKLAAVPSILAAARATAPRH